MDSSSVILFEAPFTKEEIFKALKDSDGDKATEPHGFPLKFAQSF